MLDTDQRWQDLHGKMKDMDFSQFWKHPAVRRAIAVGLKHNFQQYTKPYKKEVAQIMDGFRESDCFPGPARIKAFGARMNKSTEQYVYQCSILLSKIKTAKTVLEIGAGFGGFSRVLRHAMPVEKYTILDQDEMLDLARWFLSGSSWITRFVPLAEKKSVLNADYDLLVTNYCLSETPVEYQQWVFDNVFHLCKEIFIIDGDPKSNFPDRLESALKRNHDVTVEPYPALAHQRLKIFHGKKI